VDRDRRGGDIRAQVALRFDARHLYDVITLGEAALAAQAAGDWNAFAAAHKTMLSAEISSQLPQITQRLHAQRQRKSAQSPRSAAKQAARQLYDEHHPASAKDLLTRLEAVGLNPTLLPKLQTVRNWLTEFRRPKKKSR
jgi:predicted Zn-dependent peptidase